MKKLFLLVLAVSFLFICCGCTKQTTNESANSWSATSVFEEDVLTSSDVSTETESENSDELTSSSKITESNQSDNEDNSTQKNNSANKDNSDKDNSNKDNSDKDNSNKDNSNKDKVCTHTYSKATCTMPKTCTMCKKTVGEAKGHSYSEATCTKPKTCTVCKSTEGKALGHKYSKATCTTPKTCAVCNKTVGEALGHSYSEATCTKPKTCTKCGKTSGTTIAHSYSEATCTKPKTCSKCGKTSGTTASHSYSDATCTLPQICSSCGDKKGSALPHNYVAGECVRLNGDTVCGSYDPLYCPKLYFEGDMSEITKESQRNKNIECNITFEYRSSQQKFDGAAKIKIQGSSSTAYRKKNYTIKLYEDSTYSKKQKIDVGWGAQNKYCLKANWIDKTHSRNVVTAKIVGKMQAKYGLFESAPNNGAIDGFPVEVYINGEFHGLYTMNIPKDEWMFNMDSDNENHIVLCGENWLPEGNAATHFKTLPSPSEISQYWSVEVGPETDATYQKAYRLFEFITNSTDQQFKQNFDQYLNLDATLNYYIMMVYGWMPDNMGKNMLLVTYDGNVWYPSLYDLDTTWGAHWKGESLYNYQNSLITAGSSVLWQRMERLYKKEIAERYFELRQDILDPVNVMREFNNFYNSIPQEVLVRETTKWTRPDSPIPGYDFSQIQSYLDSVVPRLDQKFRNWQ